MKIKISQLRTIIREVISESLLEKEDLDKDNDGDKDFADIMMSRMMASGLDDEEALEKSRKFDEIDELDELEQG